MRIKLLGILFCGILLLGVSGCKDKINKNVTLSLKEGTLTNKGVTLILKNNSKINYSYGEPYYIEQEKEGKWRKLETIHDMVFNMPAWELETGTSVELSIDWEYGYGQLESGNYRIVKEIFKESTSNINNSVSFNVYAKFEIDETKPDSDFTKKISYAKIYVENNDSENILFGYDYRSEIYYLFDSIIQNNYSLEKKINKFNDIFRELLMIRVSKHADLHCDCILCYIYAWRFRCTKLRCSRNSGRYYYRPPPKQSRHPCLLCFFSSIHAGNGYVA